MHANSVKSTPETPSPTLPTGGRETDTFKPPPRPSPQGGGRLTHSDPLPDPPRKGEGNCPRKGREIVPARGRELRDGGGLEGEFERRRIGEEARGVLGLGIFQHLGHAAQLDDA